MPHHFDWDVEDSSYRVNDRWIKVRADRCRMPDGTLLDPYYVIEHSDWITIIPITKNGDIVMVRQYRHGIGKTVLELPAGCIDTVGDCPNETAQRELREETGYTSQRVIELCAMPLNTSNHNNKTHCFLAEGCEQTHSPDLDETEQIEVELVSPTDVLKLIEQGELQALHVGAFLMAVHKFPELFNL